MHQQKQKILNNILLVQLGSLGPSLIDHLISPIARANNVKRILLFCHHQGPPIPNVEYHCPPKLLAKFVLGATIFESINLYFYSLSNKSVTISGFYLNPHGIIAFIIAKLTGKKVVVSLIAGRPELYTKGSTSGIDFSITPLPWYGKIYLNILKHSDAIVTTGSVTKNFLVMQGVTADKIYPIISPANATRFYVTNQPKIYDILSVGYLYLIKHQEVFLKAISLVKDNYPDIKACVVGYGPLKDALVKLADELGISKNVDFVGFQTNISFYYNASKIFVHTSESEGFPNVVLEAMMCGVPCVVSNCGDIIDLAKDGVNSTVIQKFDDYEGFAKAIISLLENTQLYYSLRQNALKTMELTSIENVTQLWELIMAKLLLPMTNNTN